MTCDCLETFRAELQKIVDFNWKEPGVNHERYAATADILSAVEKAIASQSAKDSQQ